MDIFNDRQSFKLRLLPMIGIGTDNPMNKQYIPRRKSRKSPLQNTRNFNADVIYEFTASRDQIKPYYESYEQEFDGTQFTAHFFITCSF